MKNKRIKLVCLICMMLLTPAVCAHASEEKTAAEAVEEIQVGWNLGNSFACCDERTAADGNKVNANSVSYYETLWGNPETTQAMIHAVKEAGFNAVRIPVTYYNHIDSDGKIDEEWLSRIAEVVTYALNEDMYVIINVHHDTGDGSEKPIQADLADIDEYKSYAQLLWKQIAMYFREYDSRLMFEGFNETLDMSAQNPWYGNEDSWRAMNILNQSFVDVVRATGGKNRTRNLIVNTYGSQTTSGPLNHFEVPKDKVYGHIIVGAHTYVSSEKDIKNFMGTLFSRFAGKGIPVLVGEFGTPYWAEQKTRVNSAINFMNYGNMYGIKCFWWDDGGNYGLLDRKTLRWKYPQIVNGMMMAIEYAESAAQDSRAHSILHG